MGIKKYNDWFGKKLKEKYEIKVQGWTKKQKKCKNQIAKIYVNGTIRFGFGFYFI